MIFSTCMPWVLPCLITRCCLISCMITCVASEVHSLHICISSAFLDIRLRELDESVYEFSTKEVCLVLRASGSASHLSLTFFKGHILVPRSVFRKFVNGGKTFSTARFRKRIAPYFEFFNWPHSGSKECWTKCWTSITMARSEVEQHWTILVWCWHDF
jgi:hypothetical protein